MLLSHLPNRHLLQPRIALAARLLAVEPHEVILEPSVAMVGLRNTRLPLRNEHRLFLFASLDPESSPFDHHLDPHSFPFVTAVSRPVQIIKIRAADGSRLLLAFQPSLHV